MKKIAISIAFVLSVLVSQAQTKSTTAQPVENATDDQASLAKDYLSQIMGVAISATSI